MVLPRTRKAYNRDYKLDESNSSEIANSALCRYLTYPIQFVAHQLVFDIDAALRPQLETNSILPFHAPPLSYHDAPLEAVDTAKTCLQLRFPRPKKSWFFQVLMTISEGVEEENR